VPVGNIERAREVGEKTRAAGMECAAYGAYYKIGCDMTDFEDYAKTAQALGTNVIRIWGGWHGSAEITPEAREKLIEETKAIAAIGRNYGMTLAFECHHGTITDDPHYALDFIRDVGAENLKMYWQPNQYVSVEENLTYAKLLAPYTVHLHVFNWYRDKKFPLEEATDIWKQYLAFFERDKHLLLEFMPDGRLESLAAEAATLKKFTK
jgi:sugar phosphate isomerase/epimerase